MAAPARVRAVVWPPYVPTPSPEEINAPEPAPLSPETDHPPETEHAYPLMPEPPSIVRPPISPEQQPNQPPEPPRPSLPDEERG